MKNQLTQELQHLTTSFAQLKAAQGKFRDCGVSVRDGVGRDEGALFSSSYCFRDCEGGGGVVREKGEGRGDSGYERWETRCVV